MKEKLAQLIKKSRKNEKGFTLIEMIVVIAIIGVLAAILVPSMSGYINSSKEAKREANARTLYTAAQAAVTSNAEKITSGFTLKATYGSSAFTYTTDPTGATGGTDVGDEIVTLMGGADKIKNSFTVVVDANGSVTSVTLDGKTYPQ